ncbi:MAG: L-2-amino-thiazoline-4-carboxylic acid hydrolase [Alphaproteobacteria bacterium]|nr:L-2-amino-thiazoline-4-carboxylic acid hydrolase [Alphaproteobacteria bacterium]MBU0796242.1 L-2-amino-thiazoline-4-carboxylic acid hydrolase [Alphaproteobacteria bacterium]MBU0885719.1 L-2-amino-thiazoline-4-carboxylic acid hydrolase [Alphaproteobacteria bacterium]MBU1813127.1 L-2-amino-thiazoline-4-carboxylic acid hydrolase [Alphaproteobacteria bacterium]MBU2092204.1 L-2-amino-thiazoline-4-carboxylic acid hydrolase [Alphaproteobacteria bacterium]
MAVPPPKLTILEQRRIEAGIVKPIYETLERELGVEQAQALIGAAIRQAALDSGQAFAAEETAGTSLESFAVLFERWKEGGAYDFELLQQTPEHFDFNIRRCAYAEMYKDMGLGHIGHLLSCQRDGALCEGYDPKIEMTRTQTVMQGASHCDFRFRYVEGKE